MGSMLNLDAITIAPELQSLLPQQNAEALRLIADAVADEKQPIQPLTVWKKEENNERQYILVDGHTRYDAMKAAGMTQASVEFRTFEDMNEAKTWMIKLQLGRRNLTESQRAMIAARLSGAEKCRNSGTSQNTHTGTPQAESAKLLNVSRDSVQQATAIIKTAEPEVDKAVDAGALPLNAAKQVIKAAPEVQREIAASPDPKKAVKELLSKPATFDGSVQDGQYNGKKFLKCVKEFEKLLTELELTPKAFDAAVSLMSTADEESLLIPVVNKIHNAAELLVTACGKTRADIAAKRSGDTAE